MSTKALATDAGKDYVPADKVRVIVAACQKLLSGLHAKALNDPAFHKPYDDAMTTARELGLLENASAPSINSKKSWCEADGIAGKADVERSTKTPNP